MYCNVHMIIATYCNVPLALLDRWPGQGRVMWRWGLQQAFLHQGQREPDVADAREGAGDNAQYPGAFAPAEHLCNAVPRDREHQQYPHPPGDAGQPLFAQDEGEACQEYGGIDGEVAFTEAELVPEDIERMRWYLSADIVERIEELF